MTPLRFCGTIQGMKVVLVVGALASLTALPSAAAAEQTQKPDRTAEAYAQFMLGHRLDEQDDEAGAVAAYKRAMELDPKAAEIPGELAGLYLRQNKVQDAISSAEQALKLSPENREGNRVLGIVNAALADGRRGGENADKAIEYLERSIAGQGKEADPNVRATLSRLYVSSGQYDKAIPLLST